MAFSRASVSPATDWTALIAEWLAGLFIAPLSAEAVIGYRNGLGATLLDILADELGCGSGADEMRSALVAGSPTEVARKLAVAFTMLFDGVGSHRTVSLYESAHLTASGRLFQAPASDMDRLLRQVDLSTNSMFREPPDHLSIELALLAQLIRQGTGRHAQIALLDDHLLAWVPMFADQCCASDSTGFYAGAARALAGFLVAHRFELGPSRTITPKSVTPRSPAKISPAGRSSDGISPAPTAPTDIAGISDIGAPETGVMQCRSE